MQRNDCLASVMTKTPIIESFDSKPSGIIFIIAQTIFQFEVQMSNTLKTILSTKSSSSRPFFFGFLKVETFRCFDSSNNLKEDIWTYRKLWGQTSNYKICEGLKIVNMANLFANNVRNNNCKLAIINPATGWWTHRLSYRFAWLILPPPLHLVWTAR